MQRLIFVSGSVYDFERRQARNIFKDISSDFGALSLEHKCISGLCHAFCKLIKMEHNVAESTI